jgi:hypothetical protein
LNLVVRKVLKRTINVKHMVVEEDALNLDVIKVLKGRPINV